MAHFVVIGGGLAGLTAANALAGPGAKVTLLEQSRYLGGRARTSQQAGHNLNLGAHALYRGGIAARTFLNWEIPFSGGDPGEKHLGARAVLVRGRDVYPAVKDFGGLLTTRLFSARERLEVARLISLFKSPEARPSESMAEWLTRQIRSNHVRDYAATIVRIASYSTDLRHLNAQAAMQQISLALKHGVLYLDGGWQTLVDGLMRRASSLGVEIRCAERITSLENIRADGIVLAVDPETVEQLTGVTLPARRAAYVANLDLCLSRMPEGATTVAFALDRPLYFSVHSAVARLAGDGGATIHVMKYLEESEDDAQALRIELEEYADLVMPQWRYYAQRVRFLPRLMVTAAIPGVAGRASVGLPGIGRVAFAGDWVGSEGMLADAAVASALRAARTVQQGGEMAA
jgi:phytoene dehydrogenase-like protein